MCKQSFSSGQGADVGCGELRRVIISKHDGLSLRLALLAVEPVQGDFVEWYL